MNMTKLRSVGGSVMFAIPKAILEGLDLSANSQVSISVSNGCLIVEPHPKPRYTLAALLGEGDILEPATNEDKAWLEDAPIGREVL
jgi:antitoxin ChpS